MCTLVVPEYIKLEPSVSVCQYRRVLKVGHLVDCSHEEAEKVGFLKEFIMEVNVFIVFSLGINFKPKNKFQGNSPL